MNDQTERHPCFRNPQGYDMRMVPGKDLFEFFLDYSDPLTYCDGAGHDWQPDRHFLTDRGSIPNVIARLPGFSRNRLAFLFHDSAYNYVYGRGHGLYRRMAGFHEFSFVPLTRRQADDLMREMLLAEGVAPWAARTIWAAVRVFARRW
jgi:hypothetical protein